MTHDPYQAPATSVPPATSAGHPLWLVLGLLSAVFAALVPTLAVPMFAETFRSFGAELSPPTRWLVDGYLGLWVLPLLVVLVRMYWPRRRYRALAAGLCGLLGALVVLPLCAWALYLPIFRLGETI
ncbi:hypothetical protein [Lysobacter silvisoli]|uniref:Uncharacterized protein n=1 Tax=Lysobacter silvisoli TaxID=2293254 RepID=A0A371K5M1_9GAMM|nr:hypothetical protein [Lysobacter silvisoli]RDZ29137.1 hypothetical protein DX914_08605 [Lysobacter silvisoli]